MEYVQRAIPFPIPSPSFIYGAMYEGLSDSTSKLVSSSLLSVWKESSKSLVTSSTVKDIVQSLVAFAHASHVVYALYAHAMQLQFTTRAPALLGVAPCLYTPSILTHAHVQLGKTPQNGSCICQCSLFVTIVGRDSSAAKRVGSGVSRMCAYMCYGPQRSGISVRIYALRAPKGVQHNFSMPQNI